MAESTRINWCDSTFNPWIGCTKVSPACDNCYAERDFDLRRHVVNWGPGQTRKRTSPANWKLPLRWNKAQFIECVNCGWRGEKADFHKEDGAGYLHTMCPNCAGSDYIEARRRVFCASLADVFDNEVDPQWRADLFALIEKTPNLDWLLLTKRIGNVAKMAPLSWIGGPIQHGPDPANIHGGWPANVWLGASVCNQTEADRDIPKLLAVPAAVRFLSIEPMLGPITFRWASWVDSEHMHSLYGKEHHLDGLRGIGWVICGGESGPKARPMHPDWPRQLCDQCGKAGVPFLFKQWGEYAPALSGLYFYPLDGMPQFGPQAGSARTHDFGDGYGSVRIGVKVAGRALDGREHNEFPKGIA